MNDEQQLWKDVQKLLNQYPGLIAIARKIGEIGDLKVWQENEQRKLEALTQEVEKQRAMIISEREAMNAEVERKLKESEAKLKEQADQMRNLELTARTNYDAIQATAEKEANRVRDAADAKAKEIIDVIEPRKAALESEIAALMDTMLATKNEHEAAVSALAAAKNQHAEFIKKIVGAGG
jgi:chromosome segregation ATPase